MIPLLTKLASVGGYLAVQATALVGLALTSYVLGSAMTRRLSYPSVAAEVTVTTALGLGCQATLLLALGFAGLLNRWMVVALVVAIHVVGRRTWRRLYAGARHTDWRVLASPSALAVSLAVTLVGLTSVVLALYPPTGFDATLYHLPQASIFIETHGVPFSPELRYPVFPHLLNVLFAQIMLFWDDSAAALVQTLCMLLIALGLFAWAQLRESPRVGLWAASLWLGNPAVLWFGAQAYVDHGLALFVTVACFTFGLWARTRHTTWLILSGAFCGFAAATKYHGLFFLVALGVAGSVLCWKRRSVRPAALFCLAALLVLAPWYARIYAPTGNPVFPFFSSVFGASEWSMDLARVPYSESPPTAASPASADWLVAAAALPSRGLDVLASTLAGLASLPWDLAFRLGRFPGARISFSPALLLLSPLLVVAVLRRRWLRPLVALALVYVAFWLQTVRDVRYLLSAVALLSFASAVALAQLLPFLDRAGRRAGKVFTILVCTLALLPAALFAVRTLSWRGLPPVTEQERRVYLHRLQPLPFHALEFLNDRHGGNYRVYAVNSPQLTHFAEGDLLGDWFGPYRFTRISRWIDVERLATVYPPSAVDSRGFYDALRSMDVGFFLTMRCEEALKFPVDEFFRESFELVFSKQRAGKEVCLWQLAQRLDTSASPD